MIPADHVSLPSTPPSTTVFLFSDAGGWSAANDELAQRLVDRGAAVVGVDLPNYLQAIANAPGDCVYLVSDLERLSQQIMRAAKATTYRLPLLAGSGVAGGLVLGIAAQTPAATIGGTVAVDPTAAFPSPRTLCSGAPRTTSAGKTVYGLEKGFLPDPIEVILTEAATMDGRGHVEDLVSQGFAIKVGRSGKSARTALETALVGLVALPQTQADSMSDLPI